MTHVVSVLLSRRGDFPVPIQVAFWVVVFGLILFQAFRFFDLNERFTRFRTKAKSHDWPVVQASIDVATGVEREVGQSKYGTIYNHLGVLNYFYKAQPTGFDSTGDDRRMGEFEKTFDSLEEAKEWAEACKGLTVKVHVNPRNPDDSILMDEDVPNVAGL
jgi:hypothetical protein